MRFQVAGLICETWRHRPWMNMMRQRAITEVLTSDHHFEQEGFMILLKPRMTEA